MWLIPVACLVVLGFAAVRFGYVPPPGARTVLHVRAGDIRVAGSRLKPHAKADVAEILSEAGVSRGFIAVTRENRVKFSRHIPAAIHQRLRNVLLNQWA
jgi:hypothetical protein